jgi:DNA polymerase
MKLEEEPYYTPAEPPATKSLARLRRAAKACKACHLWRHATQTVFGEGAARVKLLFIGEQPGDKEDLAGEPFVGPAGALLRKAMAEAEIDTAQVYVTNAVKHFKWVLKNKKRIHASPNRFELEACHPWLEAEIAVVLAR